jgi:xylan 1,4-beta-xylosidase
MTVEVNASGLTEGDNAGLALLSYPFAGIGVVKTAEGTRLQYFRGSIGGRRGGVAATIEPIIGSTNPPAHLWLRVHCNFDTDQSLFSWSADGKTFTTLGEPLTSTFQLTTFQGIRPALFNFNTSGRAGGYADFDNYTVDEPRARGIEREIPMGKTITLTSCADAGILAANGESNVLMDGSGDVNGTVPADAKFRVVDLALGRVAFKTSNGKFVSAGENGVTLKDLAGRKPGNAESFQWINLMRGDTCFMSLVNHRYLTTKPKEMVPLTADATGPSPARQDGACFKWKVVD